MTHQVRDWLYETDSFVYQRDLIQVPNLQCRSYVLGHLSKYTSNALPPPPPSNVEIWPLKRPLHGKTIHVHWPTLFGGEGGGDMLKLRPRNSYTSITLLFCDYFFGHFSQVSQVLLTSIVVHLSHRGITSSRQLLRSRCYLMRLLSILRNIPSLVANEKEAKRLDCNHFLLFLLYSCKSIYY